MNMNLITTPERYSLSLVEAGVNVLVDLCHGASKKAGWYNNPRTGKPVSRNLGEMLCLIHSEVSEAAEGEIHGGSDDKLRHRSAVEVELADALIRIFDYAGYRCFDLGEAVIDQLSTEPAKPVPDKKFATKTEAYVAMLTGAAAVVDLTVRKQKGRSGPTWTKRLVYVHIALSRVMEAARKDRTPDEVHWLATAAIGICAYAAHHGLDVAGALVEKMAFNAQRADHKPTNRRKAGGKKW